MIGCNRIVQLALAGTLVIGTAHAQPAATAAATVEFDKGRDLLKQGKFPEACEAFAHSQKLDPAPGTLYNLAGCYVKIGKLSSAWLAYRELAQTDPKPARKQDSAKQAAALEPRLAKLTIVAPSPAPAGLAVTLNGEAATALVGVANPVDPGSYAIVAKAPGFADFTATAQIAKEGETTTIEIALVRPHAPDPVKPPPPPPDTGHAAPAEPREDQPAPSHKAAIGIATGVAGVAVVATGLVFGTIARGKWSDVKKLCGADLGCEPGDLAQGKALSNTAHHDAALATGLVIGGAAIAAAGIYLFVTAPRAGHAALRVSPSTDGASVGLTLQGGF